MVDHHRLFRGRPRRPRAAWYKLAATQYRRALAIDSKAADAVYNLGHLYMDYLNDNGRAGDWYARYLGMPKRQTSPGGRKHAQEQLAEIAYQDGIYCKMIQDKAKQAACRSKAAARQARWKAIRAGTKRPSDS